MLPAMSAMMLMTEYIAFTPTDTNYDASTSVAIPTNSTGYEIWTNGGGGGGGSRSAGNGGGGGGGGNAYRSGSVLPGEWGASLTLTIGAAGVSETSPSASDATAGGNSSLTGTLGGVAINMIGNGGDATNGIVGASGGSASGGSVNTSGADGDPGDVEIPSPGAGGAAGVSMDGRGDGGAGEGGSPVAGRIRIKFT